MALIAVVLLLALGYMWFFFFVLGKFLLLLVFAALGMDIYLLYSKKEGIEARRLCSSRFSNGDDNNVEIYLESRYGFNVHVRIVDEAPVQFQFRDIYFRVSVGPGATEVIHYFLKPVARGEYHFGLVNVFVSTALSFAARRYKCDRETMVKVYPAYLMMRHYEIVALSNRLTESGIKKIRKIGHNIEFEHIKDYVKGDDYRTINWKATARKSELMVNLYQDERSQNVYSAIDMGRVMQMPFAGLSLLDYAINASLIISNIAIKKDDKAGLLTFEKNFKTFLPAGKRKNQMNLVMEALYNQQTTFGESDFSKLFIKVKSVVKQRSLLLLYTNFESIYALERQLFYLKKLSLSHLLVVIFFENTELDQLLKSKPGSTEDIYHKVIAEKFAFEKKAIVKTLAKHGIQAILTKPKDLNVNVINKYIELKARGMV